MLSLFYHRAKIQIQTALPQTETAWTFAAQTGIFDKIFSTIELRPEEPLHYLVWDNHLADAEAVLMHWLQDSCLILEAAGGLVRQSQGKILGIYRGGVWDLPKGKTEKGETLEQTALREVAEETNLALKDLRILNPLITTYHLYRHHKKGRILKKSHWFLMETQQSDLTSLKPQVEEGIEQVLWANLEDFKTYKPLYPNIALVLEAATNLWP